MRRPLSSSRNVRPFTKPSESFVSADDPRVVEQAGAVLGGGGGEIDEQAGVVELPVVVDHAATQSVLRKRRDALEHFFAREDLRGAKAVFAREQIIDLHADAVERRLPPFIIRHDELHVANQVRRVLQQQPTLLERFHHQRNIAVLEVTHAAVDELGRAARRALAEVMLLEQQHAVTARLRRRRRCPFRWRHRR